MNNIPQKNRQCKTKAVVSDQNLILKKMLFSVLITLGTIAGILGVQSVWAEEKITPNQDPVVQEEAALFIKDLADRALSVLGNENFAEEEREQQFREMLHDGFNIKYIGRLSLGRHRKQASKGQLNEYYDLFPEYLIKSYATRMGKLETKEIQVGNVIPNGKKDMYVRTKVINAENKSYDVDWRVRPYNSKVYKIIDVKIEGISMARTQRDDFTARVANSGVDGLNNYMKAIIDGKIEPEVAEPAPESNERQNVQSSH